MPLPTFAKAGVPTVTLSRGQSWPVQTSIDTGQVVGTHGWLAGGLRQICHARATLYRAADRRCRSAILMPSGPSSGIRWSTAASSPLPGWMRRGVTRQVRWLLEPPLPGPKPAPDAWT